MVRVRPQLEQREQQGAALFGDPDRGRSGGSGRSSAWATVVVVGFGFGFGLGLGLGFFFLKAISTEEADLAAGRGPYSCSGRPEHPGDDGHGCQQGSVPPYVGRACN